MVRASGRRARAARPQARPMGNARCETVPNLLSITSFLGYTW